jgi:hypothetical protein
MTAADRLEQKADDLKAMVEEHRSTFPAERERRNDIVLTELILRMVADALREAE